MMRIVVASKNPVKINAALNGFKRMFPGQSFELEGILVDSGVGAQPRGDAEIFRGASNRCHYLIEGGKGADFFVGIEGGVAEKEGEMEAFAWVVIKSKAGLEGKGRTGTFFLPPEVQRLVNAGKELGEADDIVFGRENSKQQNGAVGILTGDVVDRTHYYTEAVILALIPFKNEKLYFNS